MIFKLSLDLPDDGAYIPLTRQFGRGLLEYLRVVKEDIGDVETIDMNKSGGGSVNVSGD